ncbi:MAG: hypothetical protein IJR45_03080, partial [Firmicutes bacterium]|nr:hypothetical protein [Bacillota bacterium]
MKTDIFELTQDEQNLEIMLDEAEKAASYSGLDKKQTIRLRLLAEELIGMLPETSYYSTLWSLEQYKMAEKAEDEWDELEKSIIANLADD